MLLALLMKDEEEGSHAFDCPMEERCSSLLRAASNNVAQNCTKQIRSDRRSLGSLERSHSQACKLPKIGAHFFLSVSVALDLSSAYTLRYLISDIQYRISEGSRMRRGYASSQRGAEKGCK